MTKTHMVLILLTVLFLVGCTNNNSNNVNTPSVPVVTPSVVTPVPLQFSVLESSCDNTNMELIVNANQPYSGNIDINILDGNNNTIKNLSVTDSISSTNKLLQTAHNISFKGSMNYEVCINSDCKQGTCYDNKCVQYMTDDKLCNLRADCVYQNGLCETFSCGDYRDNASCSTNSIKCEWITNDPNVGTDYCKSRPCFHFSTESDCLESPTCTWNERCMSFACTTLPSKATCATDYRCKWSDSDYGSGYCESVVG